MTFPLPNPPQVKLISNTLPAARAGKLRLAWFILGMAFGIGCSVAFSPTALPQLVADSLPATEAMENTDGTEVSAQAGPEAAETLQNETDMASTDAPEVPELAAAELAPMLPPVAEPVAYPLTKDLVVASGDTFVTLMGKAGIGAQESHNMLDAMGKKFNPRSLGVNDKVAITLDKPEGSASPVVTKLSIAVSNASFLEINRGGKGEYNVKQVDVPVVKKLARAGGNIDSSLYETMVKGGMPSSLVGEIIKAYSYDVDFQRDIHGGDSIDVVFERTQTEDGKPVAYGNIIYASLDLGDRELRIYRYTDKAGNTEYFNAKGESVRKALLKTPINGARISSGFGMRNHPILGYSKMHKGVDFAAPTGTPIYAAGDGTVAFVGRKGGYGNYLQIKHNAQYASAYAHLSRFATGIAPGKKVKQGQIVAYVGTTGQSTGPHLHYEILMAGAQVNPSNVKFKTGTILAGAELKSFKRNVETLQAQLNTLGKPSGKLAMLDMKPETLN